MKSTLYFSIATLAVSAVDALALSERSASPGVVHFDIQRRASKRSPGVRDQYRKNKLRKRDNTLLVTLDNEEALYFANVTLGTPAQSLRLDIDTGSSDIWANSATSNLCTGAGGGCSESGTYNANKSSTYQYVNSEFQIEYADGSYARGDYATDVFTIGGTSIKNVPFGVGYQSTSSEGVMGVGYMTNEAAVATTGKSYYNLPSIMKQAGLIESLSYSLWLNDLNANEGSILFGGIDTGKFKGSLSTLPIIQEQGEYREFIIALTGLTANGKTIISNGQVPVLLDSGSSLTYLPTTYAQAVFTEFNAQYDQNSGEAIVDCSLASSGETFVYQFSGVQITVDMSELVLIAQEGRGQETCVLGISDAGTDSEGVLGDTFLRSAYVVYDLDANTISLAQTLFNSTTSNVEAVGTTGVPSATAVASAVTSLAISSGNARGPDATGLSSTSKGAAATPHPIAFQNILMGAGAVAGLALAL